MTLQRLARELDETAEQSARMAGDIGKALGLLADVTVAADAQRRLGVGTIIAALQAQDRIEQRCRALAEVARQLAVLTEGPEEADAEPIWSALSMDELRLLVQGPRPPAGEAELF